MKKRFKTFIHCLIKNIKKPEMQILPGQLAFYFVLMLIPLVALLGSVINIIHIPRSIIEDSFSIHLPSAVSSIILQISTEDHVSISVIIFLISSLILSSNGTDSMIIASDQIYKIKPKSYIKRRIKAIIMLISLIITLIFMVVVLVFGDKIIHLISTFDHGQKIYDLIYLIYAFLRYPFSFILIYVSIKVLYIMAPDKKIKSNQVTYGTFFTSITWIIATRIYSIYVEKFAHYDTFYGSLSNIIVLLLWIYILAYVFVLGMTLNATGYDLDTKKENSITK